jgi:hypothetical protein
MAEDEEGIERKHGLQLIKDQPETLSRRRGRRLDVEECQRVLRPTKSSRRLQELERRGAQGG